MCWGGWVKGLFAGCVRSGKWPLTLVCEGIAREAQVSIQNLPKLRHPAKYAAVSAISCRVAQHSQKPPWASHPYLLASVAG